MKFKVVDSDYSHSQGRSEVSLPCLPITSFPGSPGRDKYLPVYGEIDYGDEIGQKQWKNSEN